MLSDHEIVNDVVGGRPLAVTYCPLCLTGRVFERVVGGEVVEFGGSGVLLMNVLVMADRASNSLWSQLLGEGIRGRHRCQRLAVVDSLQTTLATWLELHPASLILDAPLREDRFSAYYASDAAGEVGTISEDERLEPKAVVVGLALADEARAYPLELAAERRVINDRLAGTALVVALAGDGVTAGVYDAALDGRTLTFDIGGSAEVMRDRETGSVWKVLSGEVLEGPLRGSTLRRLPATVSFWFGWHDFYPHTSVFGIGGLRD